MGKASAPASVRTSAHGSSGLVMCACAVCQGKLEERRLWKGQCLCGYRVHAEGQETAARWLGEHVKKANGSRRAA